MQSCGLFFPVLLSGGSGGRDGTRTWTATAEATGRGNWRRNGWPASVTCFPTYTSPWISDGSAVRRRGRAAHPGRGPRAGAQVRRRRITCRPLVQGGAQKDGALGPGGAPQSVLRGGLCESGEVLSRNWNECRHHVWQRRAQDWRVSGSLCGCRQRFGAVPASPARRWRGRAAGWLGRCYGAAQCLFFRPRGVRAPAASREGASGGGGNGAHCAHVRGCAWARRGLPTSSQRRRFSPRSHRGWAGAAPLRRTGR